MSRFSSSDFAFHTPSPSDRQLIQLIANFGRLGPPQVCKYEAGWTVLDAEALTCHLCDLFNLDSEDDVDMRCFDWNEISLDEFARRFVELHGNLIRNRIASWDPPHEGR